MQKLRAPKLCSRYKPPIPIIAVTRYERLSRQLHLYRGVFPILYPVPEDDLHWHADIDKRINYGIKRGKARGWIHSGDFVIHFCFFCTNNVNFTSKTCNSANTIEIKLEFNYKWKIK